MLEFPIIALTPAVFAAPRKECAIAVAAAAAGSIGILDIEGMPPEFDLPSALSILRFAGGKGSTGIKCGIKQIPEILDELCEAVGEQLQYIVLSVAEYEPGWTAQQKQELLAGVIAPLKEFGLKIFVEVTGVEQAVMAQKAGADAVIGKGSESPGLVGEETSFVLLQRLRRATKLPVWMRGGIGTHTIAACVVGGAYGAVLDGQLLLTRESPLSAKQRAQLSRIDGSEISPWGQSAAFATTLAEKGVTVSGVIAELRKSLTTHLEQAVAHKTLSAGAPLAQSHSTRFPVLQGAMTRVSDTAEFALSVTKGGALPFLALALMRGEQADKLLTECKSVLAEHPWGVGVLGFVPEPLWHEQIEAVLKAKPPYALIAGGRPDQSKMLEQAGIKSYLHVPSPLLLNAFIDEGIRRFIFEGRECGGHVGPRSSFVLWQLMIDVLLERATSKEDAATYHIVFAGGIHDSTSAAMVAAMAAPLSAAGMKVGVLMGTAYLFTKEAVSSGAIVETFQRKAIECKKTALLETGPGHSIRVIDSPYRATFEAQRSRLQNQNKNWQEIREELELMNLGRLRVASKGLMRAAESDADAEPDTETRKLPQDVPERYAELSAQVEPKKLLQVSSEQQWQDGMYMIGQVAALHEKTVTIEQLHNEVCENGQKYLDKILSQTVAAQASDIEVVPAESQVQKIPIAIVGMSCMLPQANDVEKFWLNILNRVNSITEVPEKYWDWKKLYDPDPLAPDKIVSKWGGFLEAIEFDPTSYGIPPSSMSSIDPMQLLILETARKALIDAGYEERNFPRSRTSVILANAGHGPVTALYSLRSMLDWKLSSLPDEQRKYVEDILPEWTEDSFPGTLGNVTAGRVSNRFDLGGLNFAVDAACASSLAALYVGVNDLRNGGSDVVLLAATDTHNQPGDYLSFSKTHALSPDGRCKTFDATANGIAISEGIAVLVLKRLSDAEAAGDNIYAVIKGVGGSSDGRALSLTAPRPAGQALALKRAYEDAAVPLSSVSLIEAHGTGTVAGDKAEIEALSGMFTAGGTAKQMCAVGSVKSNIGHTKCTAGLASIIKVSKALHHKVLPPTIGVKTPNSACNFSESPFYISSESRPWFASLDGQPRRAGVSAFGFGGTNFHAVLEEYSGSGGSSAAGLSGGICLPTELFVFRAGNAGALKKQVAHFEAEIRSQLTFVAGRIEDAAMLAALAFKTYLRDAERASAAGVTLAIVTSSVEDLLKKLKNISGMPEEQIERGLKDPQGVYLQDTSKLERLGSIAFLFPGQGSQRLNMLADVSMYFPQVRQLFEQADRVYEELSELGDTPSTKRLSRYIFPPPSFTEEETQTRQQQLTDTSIAQVAIGVADLAMYRLMREFGIEPDMLAGHSYGEYAALAAAGALTEEQLIKVSVLRGKLMNRCSKGSMAAVTANASDIEAALGKDGLNNITLANHNGPQQCVLSGADDEIDSAIRSLKERGYDARKLPVSAAFHSHFMEEVRNELEAGLKKIGLSIPLKPVYSNLTTHPHEKNAAIIVSSLVEHTVKPVQFMQEIERMYADGARVFVEVGPGSILTNLVESILAGKPNITITTDRAGRNGVSQLQHALAALAANGVSLNLAPLFENRCLELETIERQLKKIKETAAGNKKSIKYLVNSYSIERISDNKLLPVGGQVDRLVSVGGTEQSVAGARQKAAATAQQQIQVPARAQVSKASAIPTSMASAPQPSSIPVLKTTSDTAAFRNDGSVESVMLQFQQSMAQMTNNFLQAQQNVMLAYLNGGANGVAPALSMPSAESLMAMLPSAAAPNMVPDAVAAEDVMIGASAPMSVVESASRDTDIAATATDSAVAVLSADELIAGLIDIVSERTGYPPEMLEPTLDLEADLGIDSIKRIEILSTFRKMLPQQVVSELEGSVEKLASTRTLAGIFDWIRETMASPVVQEGTAIASVSGTEGAGMPSDGGRITRGLVKVVDLPPVVSASSELSKEGTILVYEGSAEIVDLLSKRGFDNLKLVDSKNLATALADSSPISGILCLGALTNPNYDTEATIKLAEILKSFKSSSSLSDQPFILATTKLGGTFGFGINDAGDNYEQAAVAGLIKTLSREWSDVRSRVVDFENSIELGKIADHLANEIVDVILTAPDAGDYQVEVGYREGLRCGLQIESADIAAEISSVAIGGLDDESVVLLTGGARGITAQLALALAKKYRSKLILVGRQPLPTEDKFAELSSARELKAAIMEQMQQTGMTVVLSEVETQYKNILKDREIKQTLAAIETSGAVVEYHCLNVCDEAAFSKLLDAIYEKHGRIDGVVHGAGIIEDSYLLNKQSESFKRVVNTKVVPAQILADKLRFEQLQFMFFLSSIVSRTGNTGQADYVVANEVLNKLAVKLNRTHKSARIASLLWGPWNGGMARPELEALFARYGWTMISNEQGREAFMNELVAGNKNNEEVLLVAQIASSTDAVAKVGVAAYGGNGNGNGHGNGHGNGNGNGNGNGHGHNGNGHEHESELLIKASGARLSNSYALEKDGNATAIHFTLGTEEDLYLNDHCLDSVPVLPMAMATELLAEAGTSFADKMHTAQITNLQIPSGIIFDESSKNFVIRLEPVDQQSSGADVRVKAYLSSVGSKERAATARVRFTSEILLSSTSPSVPSQLPQGIPSTYEMQQLSNAIFDLPTVDEAYQKWFFHGPMFQGIQEVRAIGIDGIVGAVLGSTPAECLKTSNAEHWLVDPILLDSAMQLAGIWAWKHLDMMVLPTGFRRLSLFAAPSPEVHQVIVRIPKAMDSNASLSDHSELLCDLAIYGPSGQMVMLMEGLTGIGSRSFNRLVTQPKEFRK